MRASLLALMLLSGAAIAAPQPASKPASKSAPKPKPETQEQLFAKLKKAESAEEAHPIEAKLNAMFLASSSPSVELLMVRAKAAMGMGDAKTALKLAQAVTQIAPGYAEGWHVRAALEQAAEDDTAALISLQKVVQLNPRNFTALSELGDKLEEYGDTKGALKLYRQALALDPQLEGADRKVHQLTRTVEGQDI
jgi:tetratricopeptide (TPR) repeat protein